MEVFKQFGATPSVTDIERYSISPQWSGKFFKNGEHTKVDINLATLPGLLYKQFRENNGRKPSHKLPVLPFDKTSFEKDDTRFKAIWFGHSAVLIRIDQQNILIDPMFGANAAPISPFAVKRFSDDTLSIIDDLPNIDLALISHDHYDHLDYKSILRLQAKAKKYFVALGVGRHLKKWGIAASAITEFDWWDESPFGDIRITFTPTRHFSGRGLRDRSKSLWGGWALQTKDTHIWFSGDSGYGQHFKEVGNRLAPFDFGFMECGQYNPLWHQIHMYPEESIQAAIDAGVKKVMPVHWAGFTLAQHSWTDPVERFVAEAEKRGLYYTLPRLGEEITLHASLHEKWWLS